jgi:hypothetical protein
MVTKQIGIAHVRLQNVHAFVPAHVPHLEHRRAAARCAGQEAGARPIGDHDRGRFGQRVLARTRVNSYVLFDYRPPKCAISQSENRPY